MQASWATGALSWETSDPRCGLHVGLTQNLSQAVGLMVHLNPWVGLGPSVRKEEEADTMVPQEEKVRRYNP